MNIYHPYTIFPLGDGALTIDFGNIISEELNQKVLDFYHHLKNSQHPFITDLIPAYSSLTVLYDVAAIYQHLEGDNSAFETMANIMEGMAVAKHQPEEKKEIIHVPVCYAFDFAPDMEYITREKNMDATDVIRLHTEPLYRVYMLGFLPGFAYMGQVDHRLQLPRKKEPRLHVVAGSVGITGKQTGIYPLQSPGGWQILGRTPLKVFDNQLSDPVLFHPGDTVKFYSISEDEFTDYQNRHS